MYMTSTQLDRWNSPWNIQAQNQLSTEGRDDNTSDSYNS